jgi:hypothetical protein
MDIKLESLMKNKFINLSAILAIILLSACETASQKVVSGSAATSSSSGSASSSGSTSGSSSVDKKQSLFAQAKQTAADKLIAVGDQSFV